MSSARRSAAELAAHTFFHDKPAYCVPHNGAASALQILAVQHTSVVAGARPGENADDLQALSKQHTGRMMIVEVELLDKNSVKV